MSAPRGAGRPRDLGLIIGSGADRLGLDIVSRSSSHTPFGPPSSALLTANIAGARVLCLARHGEAHTIAPHEINYRANLWALWQHGVRRCIAINAVGAIAAGFEPGQLAVPSQLIDYTWGRESTFGGADSTFDADNILGGAHGGVVHIDFSEPFDAGLRSRLADACRACGVEVNEGGVYGVTQGPRLETAAEIGRLERDGCTMVGMTAMPEAALARELGMRYAICALGVNHAAGRVPAPAAAPREEGHGGLLAEAAPATIHAEIERHLADGMGRLRQVLDRLVAALDEPD